MIIPFDGIASLIQTVISRVFPDKSQEIKQQFDLALAGLTAESEIAKAQLAVNQQEASSESWMARNWRPMTGIVCSMSFAWTYFLQPIITYFVVITGHPAPALPALDMGEMMPILFGMLGLGAYRSFEKVKGISVKG